MKKLLIVCMAGFLFACNNESSNETVKDSTIIEQDNTNNMDTLAVPRDTTGMHDSLHKDTLHK